MSISNIYISTLRKVGQILNVNQKKNALGVIFITIVNGFIDVLGLALILPVLYLVNDPSKIESNDYVNSIYKNLSFVSSEKEFVTFLIVLLPVVFLLKNIISIIINYYQNKFVNDVAVDLISDQYKQFLKKDYLYFKNTNSNYILRDIASIPSDFSNGILLPLINFSTELFVAIFIVVGVGVYNFKIFFLLILVMLPITMLFYYVVKKRITIMGNEVNEIRSSTFKTVFEAIFGIEEVKLANKEAFFINRSMQPLTYLHNLYIKLNVLKNTPTKIIESTAVLSIVLIYFFYSSFSGNTESLMSLLVVFATASYRLMPSLNRMLVALIDIKNKGYVFETLLVFKDENLYQENNIANIAFEDSILLNNISFSYEENTEEKIINNLSLKVIKGEKIGIIGESGSGKSTLLKILLGLLPPCSGKIVVDNVEITTKNIQSLRCKLGYVQQDFYLLDASLAENVAFGEKKVEIDQNKLAKVIRLAQLETLIEKLPHGVSTNIGEFGGNLSGGQRQRIAIARALYKDAEILIFDEATSALDNETEKEIIDTINNLQNKKYTVIMVAHRITSLKFCDSIYKMENGKIIGKFNYEDII